MNQTNDTKIASILFAVFLLVSPASFIMAGYFIVLAIVVWLMLYMLFFMVADLPLYIRVLILPLAYGVLYYFLLG